MVLTSAPLLTPTPSIPYIRSRRDNFPRKRAAVRWKLSRRQIWRRIRRLPEARSVGKFHGRQIRRRQLRDAPAPAPVAPDRRMRSVTLVVTSSGETDRVLVEAVSVELSAHDDAVRGVVALSFAVFAQ